MKIQSVLRDMNGSPWHKLSNHHLKEVLTEDRANEDHLGHCHKSIFKNWGVDAASNSPTVLK